MIQKNEKCLYCGCKMESKTAKKKFCSDLHRIYYNRELKRGTLDIPQQISMQDLNKPTNIVEPPKVLGAEKSNFQINTKPPEKLKGENPIDYAARKNEWKARQK